MLARFGRRGWWRGTAPAGTRSRCGYWDGSSSDATGRGAGLAGVIAAGFALPRDAGDVGDRRSCRAPSCFERATRQEESHPRRLAACAAAALRAAVPTRGRRSLACARHPGGGCVRGGVGQIRTPQDGQLGEERPVVHESSCRRTARIPRVGPFGAAAGGWGAGLSIGHSFGGTRRKTRAPSPMPITWPDRNGRGGVLDRLVE